MRERTTRSAWGRNTALLALRFVVAMGWGSVVLLAMNVKMQSYVSLVKYKVAELELSLFASSAGYINFIK